MDHKITKLLKTILAINSHSMAYDDDIKESYDEVLKTWEEAKSAMERFITYEEDDGN